MPYTDSVVVRQGKTYTYIHHIPRQQLTKGEITFTLYEDGKAKPIELAQYHVATDDSGT